MNIVKIDGATRKLGAPEGWDAEKDGPCQDLPIRDENVGGLNEMVSAWRPDAEELAAIIAGAPIYLRVLGTGHPPVMLVVGPTPPAAAPTRERAD